jgi:hypothetical protein
MHTKKLQKQPKMSNQLTSPTQELCDDVILPPSHLGYRLRICGPKYYCDITTADNIHPNILSLGYNAAGLPIPIPILASAVIERQLPDAHRHRGLVYSNYTAPFSHVAAVQHQSSDVVNMEDLIDNVVEARLASISLPPPPPPMADLLQVAIDAAASCSSSSSSSEDDVPPEARQDLPVDLPKGSTFHEQQQREIDLQTLHLPGPIQPPAAPVLPVQPLPPSRPVPKASSATTTKATKTQEDAPASSTSSGASAKTYSKVPPPTGYFTANYKGTTINGHASNGQPTYDHDTHPFAKALTNAAVAPTVKSAQPAYNPLLAKKDYAAHVVIQALKGLEHSTTVTKILPQPVPANSPSATSPFKRSSEDNQGRRIDKRRRY